MTDSEANNASLTDFGGEDERPDEEARAVADATVDPGASVVDADREALPDADGHVDVAVTQVDYTVEGVGDDEEPVVHAFGRTPDDRAVVHVKVYGFRPYFYVPVGDVDEEVIAEMDALTGFREVDADGEPYESIRGERLAKVFGKTPRDVGNVRDQFEHYEADILFPNRFLIDKDVKSGIRVPAAWASDDERVVRVHHEDVEPVEATVTQRVNTFDIEVDDRNGFPEDGDEEIVCITSHDNYRDEYVCWLQIPDATGERAVTDDLDYDPIPESIDYRVETFDDEEAMLEAYLDYVSEDTDPDVITGWNCLPADSEVLMADGTTQEIQHIQIGDEVVGNDQQETTITEVTNKWKSEKEILEFEMADGTSLRSSEDHRIMVGDDDQVEWKEGRELEAGEYVLKPRKLNVDNESIPELSDLVPVQHQRYVDEQTVKEFKSGLPNGSVSELADRFDLATGTVYHPNTDTWTPDRCTTASREYDVSLPDGGLEYRRTGETLDRLLSEKELYLAGLVLTDGTMSAEDGIRFYNTREELHEQFPGENDLTPDGTGCFKQNVLDFALLHAFNGLGIPLGDKNDGEVDLSTVYELPEAYIGRFLAGVIDGDGNVSSSVSVAAENRSIGEWYAKLFRRLGIYATQRGNVVRVPDAEHDLQKLKARVLPHMHHSKKVAAIEELDGGKSGQSENIPYALFEAETGSDEKRIGRDKHRRGVNLKRHESSVEQWEEYVFVAIEDVRQIGVETTYDIETKTANFIAEDCLVHNCDDFDAPYFLDRLEALDSAMHEYDLDPDRLSRVNEVWRSGWGGPDVKGRVVFDLLYAYKSRQFTELDSYRLDAVGETELDVGKERYSGDIGDLWEQDPARLLEYNLRDVELCVELDRKQDIIGFYDEVRTFVGCKLEDAPTAGDTVDMYVLHKVHGEFALPSKGQQESEDYEGGAVFDPITGVKENVTVLDLKSLYPMCMVTVNASPETKVDPDAYDGETFVAPNGTHFRKEPDGMIREMVDELLAEREEKKALRNEHEPGSVEYETYDQQQGAVKVIMNCFASDTDVLTPDGVRNIRDLDVGDDVYSLDPDTMELEVKPVVETHAYPDYRDEMVDIQTSKVDFSVTPNHRMLVRKDDKNGASWDDFEFVEAGDLTESSDYELPHDWDGPDGDRLDRVDLIDFLDGDYEVWCDNDVHGHTLAAEVGYYPDKMEKQGEQGTGYVFDADEFEAHHEYLDAHCSGFYVHAERGRKWIPRFYDGDDFLELLAWYVTEGNVYTSTEKEFGENLQGKSTTVQIAQDAIPQDAIDAEAVADGGTPDDHSAIGELLDRMGFDAYVDDQGYKFTSKLLGEWLRETCGGDSFEKRIPEFVFDLSQAQKERFLHSLIAGDGDRQLNSWRYTTSSERLRDDVLRLCTHLGLTANVNRDSGSWRIYCTEDAKNSFRMHRSGSTSTAEDGAYCVTVADNHTLLAGRNGTFQFVGQSLYGVLGWDRFRLYDKEMGAAVTATGREVIEFTEQAANELDHEVAYGDSVTGDRPVVVRDSDEQVRILPIEELFALGEPKNEREVLVTADGGTVAASSPGKDRRTLEGWEALSVDDAGTPQWKTIERAIRHETDKEVVKLQHKFGESTTTRDHSYVVEDDEGSLVESKPEDVEVPFRVDGLPQTEERGTIDVYEALSGYTREYDDGRSVGAANASTKVKRVHADDEWVWFGHEHQADQAKTVKVKRHIDLTNEDGESLVRLVAAYIAEGSSSTTETAESKFGVSIAESRRAWLERLQRDYRRLFEGATSSIISCDTQGERTVEYETGSGDASTSYDDGTLKLQMMNELAAVFFREFGGQTSRGKQIPSFAFHLPTELEDLFLETLVEGDGSREFPRYSEEYAERNFDYETTSRELAGGLSLLLTKRGKKHSLKYRDAKNSYTIRTCDFYRAGRDPVVSEVDHDGYVYDLSVAENENFVDAVGGVVLHNTDSVMIELGGEVTTEEAIETSFEIEEHINEAYDDFAREKLNAEFHRFQIEFEKLYRRFFQAGKKKRYAGHIVWKEGKDVDDVDITGFEYKRSDIAPVTKEVQREVIERIVHGEDLESIKSYVASVIEDFLAGEYSYDEIAIPGGIGKKLDNYDTDTAQVRGAKYANLLFGTNFSSGSKPKRLYLENVHPSYFERVEDELGLDPRRDPLYGEFKRDPDVICFEYDDQIPEEFDVDYEKMLDKTLKGPIARVIEALGISWDEVKTGEEQTGLGSFM
jgi:DNA polymerase I